MDLDELCMTISTRNNFISQITCQWCCLNDIFANKITFWTENVAVILVLLHKQARGAPDNPPPPPPPPPFIWQKRMSHVPLKEDSYCSRTSLSVSAYMMDMHCVMHWGISTNAENDISFHHGSNCESNIEMENLTRAHVILTHYRW